MEQLTIGKQPDISEMGSMKSSTILIFKTPPPDWRYVIRFSDHILCFWDLGTVFFYRRSNYNFNTDDRTTYDEF